MYVLNCAFESTGVPRTRHPYSGPEKKPVLIVISVSNCCLIVAEICEEYVTDAELGFTL